MKSRLLKKIITAQWNPVDIKNDDILQILTDAMAYNATVQINYRGSGWRTIQPYGWNSSSAGNVLLMCHKNTGEIRSYRIDKIHDLLIEDSLLDDMPGDRPHEPTVTFQDFQMPTLPNLDQIIEETEAEEGNEELPYDEALKMLSSESETEENYEEEDLSIPDDENEENNLFDNIDEFNNITEDHDDKDNKDNSSKNDKDDSKDEEDEEIPSDDDETTENNENEENLPIPDDNTDEEMTLEDFLNDDSEEETETDTEDEELPPDEENDEEKKR